MVKNIKRILKEYRQLVISIVILLIFTIRFYRFYISTHQSLYINDNHVLPRIVPPNGGYFEIVYYYILSFIWIISFIYFLDRAIEAWTRDK